MRRPLLALTLASALALGAFAACTSSSSAPEPGASDAGGGGGAHALGPGQPIGASCDPSLSGACTTPPALAACVVVTCDPTSKLCVEDAIGGDADCGDFGEDASADASEQVAAPCTMASDCAPGEVCGFSPLEECSATGVCVVPTVVSLADGGPALACSCDGVTVSYVTSTLTSAPVASTTACPDGGVDAASFVDAASDDAG